MDIGETLWKDKKIAMRSIERGFSGNDLEKIKSALKWTEQVINSEEFRRAVIDHTWQGKRQFSSTSMSTQDVLTSLIIGREILSKIDDYEWDLDLELYYSRLSRVIGYTYPNVTTVYMNSKYFAYFSVPQVVNNIVHEHCHKLGFDHDFNYTDRRPYSVPYAVGDIAQRVCEKMKGEDSLIPAPPADDLTPPSYYVPWYKRAVRWVRNIF